MNSNSAKRSQKALQKEGVSLWLFGLIWLLEPVEARFLVGEGPSIGMTEGGGGLRAKGPGSKSVSKWKKRETNPKTRLKTMS